MKLASSSYYYQLLTDLQAQEQSDTLLRDAIERLQQDFPCYGYRRLGRQLRREGIVVNDKKIRRVQRKYQLFPIRWQSFKIATTDSNHNHKVYPNLLAEKTLTGINQAWVADITYIGIPQGVCFPGSYLGPLLAQGHWLGDLPTHRCRAVRGGPESCFGAAPVPTGLHSPLRSRPAVCLRRVYSPTATSPDADQHVADRQSLRQCSHGIVL